MGKRSSSELDHLSLKRVDKKSSISTILRRTLTLPGESVDNYEKSLSALIDELDAKTVLQVYLAEKIHDCLWWIHRYEDQKRGTIIAEMAAIAGGYSKHSVAPAQEHIRNALMQNKMDHRAEQIMQSIGHTVESLRQLAFERKTFFIKQLDMQIALQAKILTGLQASYEIAFNRKTNVERLKLQNDLMRRDLQTIDLSFDEISENDNNKAKTRKSI